MKGKFQGQDEIIINATKEKIWSVLIDGSQLGKWMRIVKHTTSKTECLNAVRSCEVDFNGKMGQVREKCVQFDEYKKIAWELEYDTLGFTKMFNNYGFSFELHPINDNITKLVNKGHYDPKNIFVSILNALMMKRQASGIRETALNGLRELSEK